MRQNVTILEEYNKADNQSLWRYIQSVVFNEIKKVEKLPDRQAVKVRRGACRESVWFTKYYQVLYSHLFFTICFPIYIHLFGLDSFLTLFVPSRAQLTTYQTLQPNRRRRQPQSVSTIPSESRNRKRVGSLHHYTCT